MCVVVTQSAWTHHDLLGCRVSHPSDSPIQEHQADDVCGRSPEFAGAGRYMAASAHFTSYAKIAEDAIVDEQQGSIQYRAIMNKVYAPIAEAGGWTGWGVVGVPHVQGKNSIDNHYLLVHLSWGRLAYILFVLIAWENIRVLLVRSWRFEALQDRAFVFSMLAAMAVLWLTLLTVYMGEQFAHRFSFLLMRAGYNFNASPGKDCNVLRRSNCGNSKYKILLPASVQLAGTTDFRARFIVRFP